MFTKPFIIAKMSGNYNQPLEWVLTIVDSVVDLGVDALKIQPCTADMLTIDLLER